MGPQNSEDNTDWLTMSQESVLRMIAYTAKMISTTASSKADISLFHAKELRVKRHVRARMMVTPAKNPVPIQAVIPLSASMATARERL